MNLLDAINDPAELRRLPRSRLAPLAWLLRQFLPDVFIEHGDPAQLLAAVGLDAGGIAAAIRQRFGITASRLAVNAN